MYCRRMDILSGFPFSLFGVQMCVCLCVCVHVGGGGGQGGDVEKGSDKYI